MSTWIGFALIVSALATALLLVVIAAGRESRSSLDVAELERRRDFEAAMAREPEAARDRWASRVSRTRDTGAAQVGHVIGAWLAVLALLALMALAGGVEGAGL